ncbi:hypothetical protein SO802_028205 [Lithocarpus litseifolius]|uniref:Uncharacterized protein n=1 Tax=Lithocarpus litseifolius TaxID=425828 RepID=A0AAW2BPW1_9ROSI
MLVSGKSIFTFPCISKICCLFKIWGLSSTQLAPNNSEERELDAPFLSSGVHVNVNVDSVDHVKELPTPGEGQSWRQPEKRLAKLPQSSGKMAHVNLLAAHRCDSIIANANLDHDSVMADSDSNEYDSDVELGIATTYIQLCIEYVQKYYMKQPMCTSILSGRSYVQEVLEGNP